MMRVVGRCWKHIAPIMLPSLDNDTSARQQPNSDSKQEGFSSLNPELQIFSFTLKHYCYPTFLGNICVLKLYTVCIVWMHVLFLSYWWLDVAKKVVWIKMFSDFFSRTRFQVETFWGEPSPFSLAFLKSNCFQFYLSIVWSTKITSLHFHLIFCMDI